MKVIPTTNSKQLESTYGKVKALLDLPDSQTTGEIFQRLCLLSRGQYLYHEGDPCDEIYLVLSGSLKACSRSLDNEENVSHFYFPDDTPGIEDFPGERLSSVIALETSLLCGLSAAMLQKLVENDSRVRDRCYRLLTDIKDKVIAQSTILRQCNAEQRIACFLLQILHHQDPGGGPNSKIRLTMSRKDIGNHLGLSLETVSRAFSRFQARGTLHKSGRELQLINVEQLYSMAAARGANPTA